MITLLNPRLRAWIYGIASALFALLASYNVVTAEQTSAWLAFVQAAVALVAALNTPWSEGRLAVVRGTLYSAAAAAFGVLGIYGLVSDDRISAWLVFVSATLAAMALHNTPPATEAHALALADWEDATPVPGGAAPPFAAFAAESDFASGSTRRRTTGKGARPGFLDRSIDEVISWARGQVDHPSQSWRGLCQSHVRQAMGVSAWAPSAIDAWRRIPDKDKVSRGGPSAAPRGAALYYEIPGSEHGHVVIAIGRRTSSWCLSNDYVREGRIDRAPRDMSQWGARYLGWSYWTPFGSLRRDQ